MMGVNSYSSGLSIILCSISVSCTQGRQKSKIGSTLEKSPDCLTLEIIALNRLPSGVSFVALWRGSAFVLAIAVVAPPFGFCFCYPVGYVEFTDSFAQSPFKIVFMWKKWNLYIKNAWAKLHMHFWSIDPVLITALRSPERKKAPKGFHLQALCNTEAVTTKSVDSDTVWVKYTPFSAPWQVFFQSWHWLASSKMVYCIHKVSAPLQEASIVDRVSKCQLRKKQMALFYFCRTFGIFRGMNTITHMDLVCPCAFLYICCRHSNLTKRRMVRFTPSVACTGDKMNEK